MKLGRTVLGAAAALGLSAAGVITYAGQAFAADVLTAKNVDEGQNVTIAIAAGACAADDSAVVDVVGTDGSKAGSLTGKAGGSVVLTAPATDVYEATLTCVSYSGASTVAGTTQFAVWPTWLDINPSTWKAGDTVTLTGYGFKPGETVSLKMVDKSSGKVVWTDATVAATNDNGVFTYSLVLKSDVPFGDYNLIATGDQSGVVRTSSFYWGQRDSSATPKPSAPVTSSPGNGLPKTGN